MMNMDKGPHDRVHWGCCWMPLAGKVLWVLALLDFIAALGALWLGGELYGISVQTWYWLALIKGVLAIGAKISRFHYCWHQRQGTQ